MLNEWNIKHFTVECVCEDAGAARKGREVGTN